AANWAGPVYLGRIVKILRNRLKAGDEDQHVVAEVLPNGHQDDGRHRPVRIPKPIDWRDAEVREAIVEHAVASVVQVAPHDRDGDERRHERREVDRAEEALEADEFGVEKEGRPEGDGDREWPTDEREVKGIPERLPE